MEGHLRGFTLVESVFSVSLVAMVFMVVLNLFPTSTVALHRARQQLTASSLAGSLLEEARADSFASLQVGPPQVLQSVTREGIVYSPTREVYRVPDYDENTLKGVRVTVTWQGRGGVHKVVQETRLVKLPR